ncbi:MAG: HlyD family efflux transporter periplasmic adaptor subunit [Clostridia bacterium]|nr:HlyD family efflux transporter periplasmic adaptor subunit [Clostridia bacterium]
MKKLTVLVLVFLFLPVLAFAATTFEGTVVSGEVVSVTAPFGGTVSNFSLRAGSRINTGDTVATIATDKVYATADGTIAGVFAQVGDSVENVVNRYGAVMYIVPEHKYTIDADIEKAYNSAETKYINIGETLYMCCTSDGSHTAVGIVTAASDTTYTVETVSGELLMEETVYLYRSPDFASKTRVGRGTVGRTAEISVNGSGSILRFHVKDGDHVSRGDLLFETVTGEFDGLYATSNEIISDVSGIIASVDTAAGKSIAKGDTLLTVYTMDSLQIEISVNEYDLVSIREGDTVSLSFNYDENNIMQTTGTVSMISHLSNSESGSEANYPAYIDFIPNENIRIGMTVSVSTLDEAATVQPQFSAEIESVEEESEVEE